MCGLKVRFSQSVVRRGLFSHALKVEVVDSEGAPRKIFVYHQMPAGIDGNTFAEFDHVATPVDLQEIPEDAASLIVPWYRTDTCVVWFRCLSDLQTAKQLFVDDISGLQRTLDDISANPMLPVQDTVWFREGKVEPAPAEDDESSGSDDELEEEFEEIPALKKG